MFDSIVAEVYTQDLLSLCFSISCHGANATPKRYVKIDSACILMISGKEPCQIITLLPVPYHETKEMVVVLSDISFSSQGLTFCGF